MMKGSNSFIKLTCIAVALLYTISAFGQQVADTTYLPPVKAGNDGAGITVTIDEAHNNFHTADGRYAPFAKVLRNSGYAVNSNTQVFTEKALKKKSIGNSQCY